MQYPPIGTKDREAPYCCDAVTIPEGILPMGCLISVDARFSAVHQVSANLQACWGASVDEALSMTPIRLLGSRLVGRLRRGLEDRQRLISALMVQRQVNGRLERFHVMAYRSDSRIVVELEPLKGPSERRLFSAMNEWLPQVGEADCPQRLREILVQSLRQLTGHDRVLAINFDAGGHGRALAESRCAEVASFLHHDFPAAEMPGQVRYWFGIHNRLRCIPDTRAPSVALIPAQDPQGKEALDLNQGTLRAISPRQKASMESLGVRSALSIAMHDDQGLRGLFVCHSQQPRAASPAVRSAVQTLVSIAAPRLQLLESRATTYFLQQVQASRDLLSEERAQLRAPDELVQGHGREWLKLFHICGVGLVYQGTISGVGDIPSSHDMLHLGAWLTREKAPASLWCTRSPHDTPMAEALLTQGCYGLMAVHLPIEGQAPGWLMLFRKEQVESRRWVLPGVGESPSHKAPSASTGHGTYRIREETLSGASAPWLKHEKRALLEMGEDLAVLIAAHRIAQLNASLAEANRRLEQLACTDPLTGLWNRYNIEQTIETEISAAERYGRSFALLLFDVDHFKQVNDQHGHEAGDQVLSTLAQEVGRVLRTCDRLGRWGGEEFVVQATGTDVTGAMELAERIRTRVATLSFGEIGEVTISIGVANWQPGDTRRSLLERADQAMYRAKHGGRNQAVLAC